jgi:DNA polymerase-4
MQQWIMHIDMDAFFASVEQLDNPALRGLPVAVGGDSDRGVVSAASYEARKFGVRSAMSVVKAKRLCPQLILVSGSRGRYKEISGQVMGVLGEFSPLVEPASIDEAYVDATGLERLFGPVEDIGRRIKQRVQEETSLTCSVGIAPIRFLAKIASDLDKPDGLSVIRPEQMEQFLRELPVGKVPGVGKRGLETLRRMNVHHCGDLLRHPREYWQERLGKWGGVLHDRARGYDPNGVQRPGAAKSSSAENTFQKDTTDRETLRKWLLAQSERVGADLRAHGYKGRTVTIKVKFSDYRSVTRSKSLDKATDRTRTIYDIAVELLDALTLRLPVRLIGVGVSNFGDKPRQLSLFDEPEEEAAGDELDKTVDSIRKRFGKEALLRGDLLDYRRRDKE